MGTLREIELGKLRLGGGNPLFLIAGPCVIESEIHARMMAEKVAAIAADAGVPYIFKASYDKANRSSLKAFRGPGMKEGLRILESIKKELKVPVLTERGTSFGYQNLVVDIRSFPVLQRTGYPVVFDVTHSVQLPGGQGRSSGGQPQFIEALARAAVAAGVDGIFLETHDNPAAARSDGPNALPLSQLQPLLLKLKGLNTVVRRWSTSS